MRNAIFGRRALSAMLAAAAIAFAGVAVAQTRTFSFAYDQPTTTAYGIAANIFDAKLKVRVCPTATPAKAIAAAANRADSAPRPKIAFLMW